MVTMTNGRKAAKAATFGVDTPPISLSEMLNTNDPFQSDTKVAVDDSQSTETPKVVTQPTDSGTKPEVDYNHNDLFCIHVIQMKLHKELSIMIPKSYFNEIALGDYERFWRNCESVQGKLQAAIQATAPGYAKSDMERIGRALREMYTEGITPESCLRCYTVLKGAVNVERFRTEFYQECLAMSKVNSNPPEGSNVTLEESLYAFDQGPYKEFRERLADAERKYQAWYRTQRQQSPDQY